jgi:hypothetical protein
LEAYVAQGCCVCFLYADNYIMLAAKGMMLSSTHPNLVRMILKPLYQICDICMILQLCEINICYLFKCLEENLKMNATNKIINGRQWNKLRNKGIFIFKQLLVSLKPLLLKQRHIYFTSGHIFDFRFTVCSYVPSCVCHHTLSWL